MNKTYDICCIGHITKDKIVTPKNTAYMSGGTAFYFSHAIAIFKDINYYLITSVGDSEIKVIDNLKYKGMELSVVPGEHSVYFENIYGENQDKRIQHVLSKASPFTLDNIKGIDAGIIHLGSLLSDDFSPGVIPYLGQKTLLSIDSQGFLREVNGIDVAAVDWKDKQNFLKHVYFLKANEHEMESLTGSSNIKYSIDKLYEWGVKEVIITLGGSGSVIFDGTEYYKIPAFVPDDIIDATGCGDTYMAGYLYKRAKGCSIYDSGCFAAAMASLKIQHLGPFNKLLPDIDNCMKAYKTILPVF
jgi:sugar/nucleoside kinase (ribokinase family)